MRKDDWGTRNRPTINVTESQEVYNHSDLLLIDHRNSTHINPSSNNRTEFTGEFFGSYDPEVGINTATVLGGLLSFLVLYVIYRTKCRKRLLKAFNTCAMKYFPEDFDEMPQKSSFREKDIEKCEEPKQYNRCKSKSSDNHSSIMRGESASKASEQGTDTNGESQEACVIGGDELDSAYCDLSAWLPELEEDIERATAEWVRNVQELDPTDKQLSSIILKIPPDLLTCPYRFREKIHSVSEYCNSDGLANISHMNQSLPLLLNRERGVISPYANAKPVSNCVSRTTDYVPIASQEESETKPKQLEVQHQSGAKVPLDICPIIKIQHYHSRSKRRLTSLYGTSSDDDSNSSDPSLVPLLSLANSDVMAVIDPYTNDNIAVSRNSIKSPNPRQQNVTSTVTPAVKVTTCSTAER